MFMRLIVKVLKRFSITLALLLSLSAAYGQIVGASISGTITDPAGAAVAGATVTLRNAETGLERSPATDRDGRYARAGHPDRALLVRRIFQEYSTGQYTLGAITKKGNRYLRKMLVVGCTSVLRVAHKHKGALAEWIVAIRARKPERVVAVALANKLARIAWAMMSTGESFRTELYTKA